MSGVSERAHGEAPLPAPSLLLQLLQEAQPADGAPWQHAWLRGGEAQALVAALCCAVWLPQSKLQDARRAAADGAAALGPLLAEAGVNLQVLVY